jgi:chromosome segregation ATPase
MLETEQQRVSNLQQQLLTEQNATATLRRQLHIAQASTEALQTQLDHKQQEIERVQAALSSKQQEVDSLRARLSSVQYPSGQGKVDTGQSGKVVRLDTNRAQKGKQQQDATSPSSENALAEQVKQLLKTEPGLSARQIAARLGCSPTTASRWKGLIETATECVNQ